MTSTLSSPPENGARFRFLPCAVRFVWLAALAVILIHTGLKPNTNTVFKVFRAGGARWLSSENLYPQVDEYIYSPLVAAFFAPLALLPEGAGGILWRVISMAIFVGAFAAWLRGKTGGEVTLAWLLPLPLALGDFFNGQANPLVIGLLMFAVLACLRERWMLAALCVAIPAYFKVYPLAIGLLLAVLYPRKILWRLAVAVVALFLLSLLLQRPAYVLQQYGNWVHSLGQDPRRTLNYFGTYRDFWLLLHIVGVPISLRGWMLLQATSGAALAAYLWLGQHRGRSAASSAFLLLALGTCWMLLFGPATESSTYVILAPPLMLAGVRWYREAPRFLWAAGVVYGMLILSQMVSSWFSKDQNAYTHAIQPVATLLFTGALLLEGRRTDDPFRQAAEPSPAIP